MMKIETYMVDSFTDKPFHGNPAGVCLINREMQDSEMLAIARELGLSETAFVKEELEENRFCIRYFSPKMEIPLCGHATLAASKVLFQRDSSMENIHFVTSQNLDLFTRKSGEFIIMQFPVYGVVKHDAPKAMLDALGIAKIEYSGYNKETNILLIEIDDCKKLKSLQPDFLGLQKSHNTLSGVLVTALSEKQEYDFESRYFWPWSGTSEDPVTGGTHTFLAAYWSKKLGKRELNSFQCSERTGFMEVQLMDEDTMTIKAQAQIVLKGNLNVPEIG